MTIEDLKEIISLYHLFMDTTYLPDEDYDDYEGLTAKYNHKDGIVWESYSMCDNNEDGPDCRENWVLVFCTEEDVEDEVYIRIEYSVTLYNEQFDGDREKISEWLANEIVKQLNEAGYNLDDFEVDYID